MLEALEVGCKVRRVKDLQGSLQMFGWRWWSGGLDEEAESELTVKEAKQALDIASYSMVESERGV